MDVLIAQMNQIWSGRWESNPRHKLGKLGYYHYTTPAKVAILCATALGFNHSVPRGVAQGNRMKAQTKPNN